PPRRPRLFPYTTLFRSVPLAVLLAAGAAQRRGGTAWPRFAGGERVARRAAELLEALAEMTRRHTLFPAIAATLAMLLAMFAFYRSEEHTSELQSLTNLV